MKDWTTYLRDRVDSEFFGFVLLDYYYKTRSKDDPETPSAFIRKVVTDYAAQTSERVKFHRALLAACVQLLGDDFTEIISFTRLFVEKHGKGLGTDELEQIVAHYNDFGKALPVRAKLLSANGRPGTSRRPAGKSGKPAEGKVMVTTRHRRAFISYCHESDEHNEWVRELAAKVRDGGIESILDQWETAPGDQLPEFMEKSVRQSDFVLVVCTPKYKAKSDGRTGGVGYEGDVMTAEVYNKKVKSKKRLERKFMPLLKGEDWKKSAPSWLLGKSYVDLRGNPCKEGEYKKLLDTLLDRRETAPPVKTPP